MHRNTFHLSMATCSHGGVAEFGMDYTLYSCAARQIFRLIGMNTAILSPSGSSAGIGFAIPVDTLAQQVQLCLGWGCDRDGGGLREWAGVGLEFRSWFRFACGCVCCEYCSVCAAPMS